MLAQVQDPHLLGQFFSEVSVTHRTDARAGSRALGDSLQEVKYRFPFLDSIWLYKSGQSLLGEVPVSLEWQHPRFLMDQTWTKTRHCEWSRFSQMESHSFAPENHGPRR